MNFLFGMPPSLGRTGGGAIENISPVPTRPGKMRVHLKRWNSVEFNKYPIKMIGNPEKYLSKL